ncbi:hypothetical protein BKA67DRAFT_369262 [Truncatella angustata]|uniref:Uncharacterized protein n=1 Tax=Truncatella angustata TaxID=152316 RepID=A0A9P8UEW7_9PEZI|nr:uncharacterized protein BKA67DRAFT_369262 [Truncatella angustata]KAH6648634.1 hypothetical protein BKA67DRAFT_369262 [Truncatella angustata]KAH8196191.1 hypothetical protein TruAng_009634 [Truncatella angustata]
MTTITAQIQEAAPRNRELLAILSETDHAVPDLEQQKIYIADLDRQLASIAKRIKELNRKREKEFKEHEKYRDSVMRRFAYKVGGKKEKFESRAAKEEREYFDALQDEHKANDQQKSLQNLRGEALRAKTDLEQQVSRHNQAQQDLDGLYNRIFLGTTPGFPEEDEKERLCTLASQAYQDARSKADAQQQAVSSLQEAQKRLKGASIDIEDALDYSRMDMFGGGSMTDMMERNALHKAEMQVSDALWHFGHAKRMDPLIHDLPPLKIARGNMMSDVFFDNIFTDMAFHDKIKDSKTELHRCLDVLNAQLQGASSKFKDLDQDQKNKSSSLDQARSDLQKTRQQIFERSTGEDSAAPPSYAPPSYSPHV